MPRSTAAHEVDEIYDNNDLPQILDLKEQQLPIHEQTQSDSNHGSKRTRKRAEARKRQRQSAKGSTSAMDEPSMPDAKVSDFKSSKSPSAADPLLGQSTENTEPSSGKAREPPLAPAKPPEPPDVTARKDTSPSDRTREPSRSRSATSRSRGSGDVGDGEAKGVPRSPLPLKDKGRTHSITSGEASDDEMISMNSSEERRLDQELWDRMPNEWVLTLSMHFRDGTQREKFFITYIREPNKWLRVSVSVDYSKAVEGSLEHDLQTMGYQRDKNFGIWKAVYHSLSEIKFFDTITNLRLETLDDRLHIHVAEDANERIPYPRLSLVAHHNMLENGLKQVNEDEVFFDQHLSGYVYRVKVNGELCVKKEITSVDTVEEFLYEINALAELQASPFVINLVGIVKNKVTTEDGAEEEVITGVLLEYAVGGPLNDYFFDHPDLKLDWKRKMTWIRQVVAGMSDIHEAGLVQGDCTLSNIVLDANNNAQIVDINRRGCPIGWEPPDFDGPIASGQRISMKIGVKSDIYQMGMVIYGIAEQEDEPDRQGRNFRLKPTDPDIPDELRTVLDLCLAAKSKDRLYAKELLTILKPFEAYAGPAMGIKDLSMGPTREDILESRRRMQRVYSREASEEGNPRRFFTQDQAVEQDDFALAGLISSSPAESQYAFADDPPSDDGNTTEQGPVAAHETGPAASEDDQPETEGLNPYNQSVPSEENAQLHANFSALFASTSRPGQLRSYGYRPMQHQDSGFVDDHGGITTKNLPSPRDAACVGDNDITEDPEALG